MLLWLPSVRRLRDALAAAHERIETLLASHERAQALLEARTAEVAALREELADTRAGLSTIQDARVSDLRRLADYQSMLSFRRNIFASTPAPEPLSEEALRRSTKPTLRGLQAKKTEEFFKSYQPPYAPNPSEPEAGEAA